MSPAEKKARANLPITRFMQAHIPMSVASWLLKRSIARLKLDFGVARETISADGVPCDWLIPPNKTAEKTLLYLHGGGFVFGQTPLHLQMGAYLAHKMGLRVLMVDYRLGQRTISRCVACVGLMRFPKRILRYERPWVGFLQNKPKRSLKRGGLGAAMRYCIFGKVEAQGVGLRCDVMNCAISSKDWVVCGRSRFNCHTCHMRG